MENVIDYRAFNNITVKEKFSIPLVEELFEDLREQWYSPRLTTLGVAIGK